MYTYTGWGESVSSKMGGAVMGRGSGRGGMGDWGDENPGTMSAGGWSGGDGRIRRVSTPGTPGSQWIPTTKDGWGKKVNILYFCV